MARSFKLTVAAPDRQLFQGTVTQINLPSVGGEMGVLAGHMPAVVGLAPGVVEIIDEPGKPPHHYAVTGGFAEIRGDEVSVLVTAGEEADNLNEEAVLEAQRRAVQLKATAKTEAEFIDAQQLSEQSLAQLKTIQRRQKWRLK